MRLISAHIRNFKLLEDVDIEFSTDPNRPLTIIRAENGAGKTSLLYALLWSFYGSEGLPKDSRGLRLTSTAFQADIPVEVQVRIEFEHFDEIADTRTRYRLIRSVTETPRSDDKHERGAARLRLLRVTNRGDEEIRDGAQALVLKLVPPRLSKIFFTNGDDVQQFISGFASAERQDSVHEAIRLLLGLEQLEIAHKDLATASRAFKREIAKAGGAELSKIQQRLEEAQDQLEKLQSELAETTDRRNRIAEAIRKDERALAAIKGIGDLEDLNARIDALLSDIADLEGRERAVLVAMRQVLQGEDFSWHVIEDRLSEGVGLLESLADRNVIPGTSIEVLRDRLELAECICGESLEKGTEHHAHVARLVAEQEVVAPRRTRQTETWHHARRSQAIHGSRVKEGQGFYELRKSNLADYTDVRHRLGAKSGDLEAEKERRRLIDEEEVRRLTARITRNEKKKQDKQTEIGWLNGKIDGAATSVGQWEEEYRKAEKKALVGAKLRIKRTVTEDLMGVADGILGVLKTEWIQVVSDRMNCLFLDIVGSDPDADVSVFKRVFINDRFDIVVEGSGRRTLDPDFELSGAQQRALTLAFIWALMEVSGREAPRIIDTPLGMTSGGVKHRVVNMITSPRTEGTADFQVVLLMTRSEIRDLEELFDDRVGVALTLSCSKDYPKDLINDWGVPRPIVRRCDCGHRKVCKICQRRYDEKHNLAFRET